MRFILCSLAVATILVVTDSTAQAQKAMYNPSAAGNMGGTRYRPYTARTYQSHAINHAQVLRTYGTTASTVPSDTAKEHAAAVRENLDKSFAELEKADGIVKDDAEAKALLAEIKAHHKKADEVCGTLEAECVKEAANGKVVADCCTDMIKELEAAFVAHDKLMKHLGVPMPGHSATHAAKIK